MLGCDFVLFRDAAGAVACLATLLHRGAALGGGELDGRGSRARTTAGSSTPTAAAPRSPPWAPRSRHRRRVRVDSYPTQEKYGWVWAFLGDLPEAERPAIPELFPEYDDPADWHRMPYGFEAKANWMRFEENSLDTAHTNFVHRQFGAKRNPKLESYPIEQTEWGARVARLKPAPTARPEDRARWPSCWRPSGARPSVTLEFSLVGLCHRIQPTFREGMSQINFTARTPVDAGAQPRHRLAGAQLPAGAAVRRRAHGGHPARRREDLWVVERVEPKLTPRSLTEEFLVETDGMEVAFRKTVARCARPGDEIDVDRFEQLQPTAGAGDPVARASGGPD